MITFYIGRSPENTIVYDNPAISGRHAELTLCDDGRIIFRDYSTNGTYVNGQFVNQNGVEISFGDSIIFPGNIPFDWNVVSNAVNKQQESYRNETQQQQSLSQAVTLNFSQTFKESFSIGFGHIGSCCGAILLWLLTCWIPYINLGTWFGLQAMVNAWAKGEPFSATDIFDSRYRRMLPELLLGGSFRCILLTVCIITVIPAVVLSIATMFTTLIILEKEYSPVEAIRESNRITYGSKWTIFGVMIVMELIVGAAIGVLGGIFAVVGLFSPAVGVVLGILELLVILFFVFPVSLGMTASMWRQLSCNL